MSSSRYGGCTVTGALSVTTAVSDAVSIIHGPEGCAHHNFSLLHATFLENENPRWPDMVSSGLSEAEIIFGGEDALEKTLEHAAGKSPGAIFVISTCVSGMIGDDIGAVAARDRGVPVIPIPSAGFLGGTFRDGYLSALTALAARGEMHERVQGVNLIGERNLEFEVEENFREVERLCRMLGLEVSLRFARDISFKDIGRLGSAEINILREPALTPLGELLRERFGTPYIDGFPCGFSGTLRFLEMLGTATGRDPADAIAREKEVQKEIIGSFADLRGKEIVLPGEGPDPRVNASVPEITRVMRMKITPHGTPLSCPSADPVGSSGVRRLLHRWRRKIRA